LGRGSARRGRGRIVRGKKFFGGGHRLATKWSGAGARSWLAGQTKGEAGGGGGGGKKTVQACPGEGAGGGPGRGFSAQVPAGDPTFRAESGRGPSSGRMAKKKPPWAGRVFPGPRGGPNGGDELLDGRGKMRAVRVGRGGPKNRLRFPPLDGFPARPSTRTQARNRGGGGGGGAGRGGKSGGGPRGGGPRDGEGGLNAKVGINAQSGYLSAWWAEKGLGGGAHRFLGRNKQKKTPGGGEGPGGSRGGGPRRAGAGRFSPGGGPGPTPGGGGHGFEFARGGTIRYPHDRGRDLPARAKNSGPGGRSGGGGGDFFWGARKHRTGASARPRPTTGPGGGTYFPVFSAAARKKNGG